MYNVHWNELYSHFCSLKLLNFVMHTHSPYSHTHTHRYFSNSFIVYCCRSYCWMMMGEVKRKYHTLFILDFCVFCLWNLFLFFVLKCVRRATQKMRIRKEQWEFNWILKLKKTVFHLSCFCFHYPAVLNVCVVSVNRGFWYDHWWLCDVQ